MFKVVVAGSRNFGNYAYASMVLDKAFSNRKPDYIVCGMARGADMIGHQYALDHKIALYEFPADWKNEGKSAGYNRNVRMAAVADAVVVFWDGESHGSKHMIDIAVNKGIPVIVCRYTENKIYKIG